VIVNDAFLAANGAKVAAVMRALKRATDDMFADPAKAWVDLQRFKKQFRGDANSLYSKMYERCFPFMSRDLKNVERDWAKVVKYCQRIGVCPDGFEANFTNEFVQWEHAAEPADPLANQVLLVRPPLARPRSKGSWVLSLPAPRLAIRGISLTLLHSLVYRPSSRRRSASTAASSRPPSPRRPERCLPLRLSLILSLPSSKLNLRIFAP